VVVVVGGTPSDAAVKRRRRGAVFDDEAGRLLNVDDLRVVAGLEVAGWIRMIIAGRPFRTTSAGVVPGARPSCRTQALDGY
jgi:hypothetical protein